MAIPWKGPGTNLGSPSPPTSPHLISLRSTQSAKYWYFEGSELRLLKGSKHVLSWGCSPEIGLSRELTLMSRKRKQIRVIALGSFRISQNRPKRGSPWRPYFDSRLTDSGCICHSIEFLPHTPFHSGDMFHWIFPLYGRVKIWWFANA